MISQGRDGYITYDSGGVVKPVRMLEPKMQKSKYFLYSKILLE